MTRRHYHVTAGSQGGYMPDTNDMYSNRRDAVRAASAIARDYREANDDDESFDRNHKYGRDGFYTVENGSLGWVIETTECTDPECGMLAR